MTNQEVIKLIEHLKDEIVDLSDNEIQAFDLAIKALKFIDENFPKTFIDYLNGEQI